MINDIFFIEYLYSTSFLILLYLYRMIPYLICAAICIAGTHSQISKLGLDIHKYVGIFE